MSQYLPANRRSVPNYVTTGGTMPVMTNAQRLQHAARAHAAYERFLIAEYRYQRYHRRWDLLVGFLAYAVPLTMIVAAAYYVYLEIL